MKKTFILLAASAMLLAACNKEEITNGYTIQGDKITFGVGVDNIQGEGKQSFNSNYGRIWFDSCRGDRRDEQMLVNGTACPVVPVASSSYPGSSASHSPLATVTADLSASGAYDFVYPAHEFTLDANGHYIATFGDQVFTPLCNGSTYQILDNDYTAADCLWPMYAGIADLSSFSGRVQLRNACAFLSTRFNYGPQWANVVFAPLTGVTYGTSNTCPSMTPLVSVFISNHKLSGSAHLDCTNPNHPVMVMDQTVAPGMRDALAAMTLRDYGYTITENIASTNGNANGTTNITHIAPIAPIENDDTKTFKVVTITSAYLDNTRETIYLVFVSNESSTTSQIKRNYQYMLDINFATAADGTFTYPEAYAASVLNGSDATIHFSNGTLFVTKYFDIAQLYLITVL